MARRIMLLVLILLLAAAGCRQTTEPTPNENVNIEMRLQPDPPQVGAATLLVTLTDAEGQPITDATVAVRGDMSHAGMVPVIPDPVEGGNDDGEYEIPFEWTMGGEWFVDVTVTLPDGEEASARFEYTLESGDGAMDDMEMESTEEAE